MFARAQVVNSKHSSFIEETVKVAKQLREGGGIDRDNLHALDRMFKDGKVIIDDVVTYGQRSRDKSQFLSDGYSGQYNILLPLMAILHHLHKNNVNAVTIQSSYPNIVKAFMQLLSSEFLNETRASQTLCTSFGLPDNTAGTMTSLSENLPIIKAIRDNIQQQRDAQALAEKSQADERVYDEGMRKIKNCGNVPAMVIAQCAEFNSRPAFLAVKEELLTILMADFLNSINKEGKNHAAFIASYKKLGSGFLYTANFEKNYPDQKVSDVILDKIASDNSTSIKALNSLCSAEGMAPLSACVCLVESAKLKAEIENPTIVSAKENGYKY